MTSTVWRRFWPSLVAIFLWIQPGSCKQSFREAPVDTSVVSGQAAILKCVVDNKAGSLQWTKDGFALGFDRAIPGFPRYQIIGSEDLGEFNLMITDAELSDDAEYQCQVGPAAGGHDALLAKAQLNVLIPPEQPVIQGHNNGSSVEVKHEQDTLILTCIAASGKPAATIKWYQNAVELTEGIVATTEKQATKLEHAKSVLTMKPEDKDNEAFFKCEATNGALHKPLSTLVQLSVLHPPSKPDINGYNTGEVKKTGDTMKLECISRGGNPLAKVYWYKNDVEIDFSYVLGDGMAKNELVFTVQPNDNNAVYRCEASNKITTIPLKTEVQLTVQFAPEKVSISGHTNAKAGETISLKCESEISNPAAEITWFSRGKEVDAAKSEVKPSPKGGFVSTSEVQVTLTDRENDVKYQCVATNNALSQTVDDSVTLKVLYPPGQPYIFGYTEGRTVTAGQIQSMKCQSEGGNPLATLTWWKGDEELQGAIKVEGSYVTSTLSFILEPDDNGAHYTCNATNEATVDPLLAKVKLSVNFPPESLSITTKPKKVKVGEKLTITCKSSTSNPASELSWWKDDHKINGIDGGTVDADWGGKSTIAKLELVPTADDNEEIYACRATNSLIEQAVSDAVTLDVPYPPVWPSDTPSTVDVVEDLWALINVTALANPMAVTYSWYRNGNKLKLGTLVRARRDVEMLHFLQEGALLNVTNVTRADAGAYVVEGRNSEGGTNFTITLNVQYAAEIKELANEIVDAGTNASVVCKVDANPQKADMVTWERTGYDMARTSVTYADGVSTLTVIGATKDDTGIFTCKANNGIGEAVSQNVEFVVKAKPEIDKSGVHSKAAADKGTTAKLTCKAEGAPEVAFSWFKGDALDTTGTKYSVEFEKTGLVHYHSFLSVHNITKADYGVYTCKAKNDIGEDEGKITLDATTIPDPPTDLKFINATHNSITIAWTAGFDGGQEQWFQVKYFEIGAEIPIVKYEDVEPKFATVYTVKGLKLNTEYEMTVRSKNRLGESEFQEAAVKTRTSAAAPLTADGGDDVPLIIILSVSIIGMILLGLNVLLILFFIRRRRKRLEKGAPSETTSQANTLEMGAPTITDGDSKSYTTFEQQSLGDYQDDIYRPYADDEDLKRFLPPPYPHPNDYYGPPTPVAKPNYYAPPPSMHPDYGSLPAPMMDLPPLDPLQPPGMDNQRSFVVGRGHREPIYMDEHMARSQGMEPQNTQGPYGIDSPYPVEDDDYAEQLRKQGLPAKNGVPSRQPPPPPARSTSRHDEPPMNLPQVPSRNYAPEDVMSHYQPPPGSLYGSSSRLPPPSSHGRPLDPQGHLV